MVFSIIRGILFDLMILFIVDLFFIVSNVFINVYGLEDGEDFSYLIGEKVVIVILVVVGIVVFVVVVLCLFCIKVICKRRLWFISFSNIRLGLFLYLLYFLLLMLLLFMYGLDGVFLVFFLRLKECCFLLLGFSVSSWSFLVLF